MPPSSDNTTVLFLHPGAMGARLAGECRAADRLWVATDRSAATVERAQAEGLEPVASVAGGVGRADLVVSICPPAAAVDVAREVAATGFSGHYLDANAVSPTTMVDVTAAFGGRATVLDGGVVGPPPGTPGTTRLFVAGADPGELDWVASLWAGSTLEVIALDATIEQPYPASALKMAYAAWTKGSSAMLMAVCAAAEGLGVADHLAAEWDRSQPGLSERSHRTAAGVGPKAWRFAGEMHEIARTFDAVETPAAFWTTAADVYDRLAPLKSKPNPNLDDVIDLLGGR